MKTAVANFFSHREFSDLPAGSLHHLSAEPLPAGRTALLELQTVKICCAYLDNIYHLLLLLLSLLLL